MSNAPFSDEVNAFLADHVVSYEQLEVIGLLQDDAARDWKIAEIASAVRQTDAIAEEALEHLVQQGLAAPGATKRTWRWAPRTRALAASAAAAVAAGRADRLAVMQILIANVIARLRSGAARTFADSFLLRRPKNDG